ncbi:MAG: hypothetical protein H6Q61_471 [Firmicutes bacterium]|nr:hypothetical protein [Bacillota bacterium]
MSRRDAFSPADILLPADCGLTRWAVVACDQYTSQPEYWERVEQFVGDAPSTLRLILPESKLESPHVAEEIRAINETMEAYLKGNRFRTMEDAFLYVERKLQNGRIRYGLLGKIDLEQYDYAVGSQTPVRATEGTVLSRIPPRKAVRQNAPIELPHIMVLIDDPQKTVIEPLTVKEEKRKMMRSYMATLMEGGGEVAGWTLNEEQKAAVTAALRALAEPSRFEAHYNAPGKAPLVFAIGDGNHSLATAKACWEEIKQNVPKEKWMTHPARYALVELVNLHDESLEFEPIHRVVFDVEPEQLVEKLLEAYPGAFVGEGEGHRFTAVYHGKEAVITVPNPEAQLAVGTLQRFLDRYLEEVGGKIDYIHGENVVRELSQKQGSIGFLLPGMSKDQLFPTVIFDGALPRKTFSMGEAHDKRFYLEARKIR